MTAPLAPGTTIGPYRVESALGSGGMGEVYRARDSRLGRPVALKLLPAGPDADPRLLARFEQEARAASALSHPNVVTVYDVGEHAGRHWLAMELVEGQSLRAVLRDGPLPVERAIRIAAQIADGLAAAHARGIVHRDLKPENVMVGDDGRARILDFGLAKLAPSPTALAATVAGDHGLLPAALHTTPGIVIGTAPYLSPEQARGHQADPRSDQFAFGAILYELLTGRRAFERDTAVDTLAAVLSAAPPPLPEGLAVPLPLLWVIDRCLAKEQRGRYGSTDDLARDLHQLEADLGSLPLAASWPRRTPTPLEPATPRSTRGRRLATAAVAALLVGLTAATTWWLAERQRAPAAHEPPTLRFVSWSGRDAEPALSRDGRLLAFTSQRTGTPRIWLQVAGGREAPLTDGPDTLPRISPDGAMVLFTREEAGARALYRVPTIGGSARRLVAGASEGDWSPDGRRIAFLRATTSGGRTVSEIGIAGADGSEPRRLAAVPDRALRRLRWSPNGEWVAVRVGPLQGQLDPEIALFHTATGERGRVAVSQRRGQVYGFAWRAAGELVYGEVTGATAAGSSRVLALDVASGRSRGLFGLPGRIATVDAAGDRIAVDVLANRQAIAELEITGAEPPAAAIGGTTAAPASRPLRSITHAGAEDRQPAYSPQGDWLVFSSNRTGNLDLWLVHLQTGEERQLTDDAADDWDPAFHPDGRAVVWSSNRGGHFEIWQMALDGTGARQISADGADAENPTVTPDGRFLVYNSFHPRRGGIWKQPLGGGPAARLVAGATTLPEVSPDGRHVLYVTDYVGRTTGVLRAARLADGAVVFATSFPYRRLNDGRPRWLPDARWFAFVAPDAAGRSGVFLQPFTPGADTTAERRPLAGFEPLAPVESFGIAPDGRRLALSTVEEGSYLLLAEPP
jgi:Tol biopolymer transport system component